MTSAPLTQSQLEYLNKLYPFDPTATYAFNKRINNPDPTNEFKYQSPTYNNIPNDDNYPFIQQGQGEAQGLEQGQYDRFANDGDRFVLQDDEGDLAVDDNNVDRDRVGGEVDARTAGGQSELE